MGALTEDLASRSQSDLVTPHRSKGCTLQNRAFVLNHFRIAHFATSFFSHSYKMMGGVPPLILITWPCRRGQTHGSKDPPLQRRTLEDVEGPGEGIAVGGADETGGFQEGSHLLRRVNESAKRIAGQPEPEVLHRNGRANVPTVAGIGEGDQAARASGRGPKKSVNIRLTADDAVESDDVGVGQGGGGFDEISEDEMSGAGAVTRGDLASSDVKISGRSVGERDAGEAGIGEFQGDHANSAADVEQLKSLKRLAAEFGEEDASPGVRTTALITAQVTLRDFGIEEGRSSAMAGATGHAGNLDGAEGRTYSMLTKKAEIRDQRPANRKRNPEK